MNHGIRQLQPLYRAIMEKLSDREGYFFKPELFTLKPFKEEEGMDLSGLPDFRVQPLPNNKANAETKNLAMELESLFMKELERIAKRDGLEMEFPEDLWLIAAKDIDTLRAAMQTLAKELGVDVGKSSPAAGR